MNAIETRGLNWGAARFPEPDRAGLRWTDVLISLLVVAVLAGIGLLVGARRRPVTGL